MTEEKQKLPNKEEMLSGDVKKSPGPKKLNCLLLLYQDIVNLTATINDIGQTVTERIYVMEEILKTMAKNIEDKNDLDPKVFVSSRIVVYSTEKTQSKYKFKVFADFKKEPFAIVPHCSSATIHVPMLLLLDYELDKLPQSRNELQKFYDSNKDTYQFPKDNIFILDKPNHKMDLIEPYQVSQSDWFSFKKFCHFIQSEPDQILSGLKSTFVHELGHLFHRHSIKIDISNNYIYRSLSLFSPSVAYKRYKHEVEADEFIAYYHDTKLINGMAVILRSAQTTTDSCYDRFFTRLRCIYSFFTHGNTATRITRIQEAHNKLKKTT